MVVHLSEVARSIARIAHDCDEGRHAQGVIEQKLAKYIISLNIGNMNVEFQSSCFDFITRDHLFRTRAFIAKQIVSRLAPLAKNRLSCIDWELEPFYVILSGKWHLFLKAIWHSGPTYTRCARPFEFWVPICPERSAPEFYESHKFCNLLLEGLRPIKEVMGHDIPIDLLQGLDPGARTSTQCASKIDAIICYDATAGLSPLPGLRSCGR